MYFILILICIVFFIFYKKPKELFGNEFVNYNDMVIDKSQLVKRKGINSEMFMISHIGLPFDSFSRIFLYKTNDFITTEMV
jgi:hypothetical protein